MKTPDGNLKKIILKPGEMYAADRPTLVTTVLGSCVSVTMYCNLLKKGAICHAVLPRDSGRDPGEIFRYVDSSITVMLEHFKQLGITGDRLEVKLFGGSDMLNVREGNNSSIGKQNIEMALKVIHDAQLRLSANDLGGNQGRKLFFKTHTGEVFLKRVRSINANDPGVIDNQLRHFRDTV